MNFKNKIDTYENHAIVQKLVARDLIELYLEKSDKKDLNSVIELGCGTGIFTKELLNNLKIENLDLNDLVDVRSFHESIDYKSFFHCSLTEVDTSNYSLIASSSTFQWIEDLNSLISSFKSKPLLFSIYTKGNLVEIKDHFSITLDYLTSDEIIEILSNHYKNISYKNFTYSLDFNTPLDALRHLSKSGVTIKSNTAKSKIRSFKENTLTYTGAVFYCE